MRSKYERLRLDVTGLIQVQAVEDYREIIYKKAKDNYRFKNVFVPAVTGSGSPEFYDLIFEDIYGKPYYLENTVIRINCKGIMKIVAEEEYYDKIIEMEQQGWDYVQTIAPPVVKNGLPKFIDIIFEQKIYYPKIEDIENNNNDLNENLVMDIHTEFPQYEEQNISYHQENQNSNNEEVELDFDLGENSSIIEEDELNNENLENLAKKELKKFASENILANITNNETVNQIEKAEITKEEEEEHKVMNKDYALSFFKQNNIKKEVDKTLAAKTKYQPVLFDEDYSNETENHIYAIEETSEREEIKE